MTILRPKMQEILNFEIIIFWVTENSIKLRKNALGRKNYR